MRGLQAIINEGKNQGIITQAQYPLGYIIHTSPKS